MDRDAWDARTDIIVVVDPRKRRLVWVPRDVWCDALGARINRAFSIGGHQALMDGLAHMGFCVNQSLCLRRSATEQALEGVEVRVRVRKYLKLWYPLSPTVPIEDGRKAVDFVPPVEILSGERLHQWIGARYARDGGVATDFERIHRQQILLRALLKMRFAFGCVLRDPSLVALSSERALADLSLVRRWWRFGRFRRLEDRIIAGNEVLVVRPRRLHFGPRRRQ
jgi:anionic cell wall polymer biosynthesis LytR-Cps2A-Psr (LCP) family protein